MKSFQEFEDTFKFVGRKFKENEESALNRSCKLVLICKMI